MRSILRASLLIAVALLVPILPLLILGLSFEDRVSGWFQGDLSAEVRFGMIVAALATDIFLPIPSSVVSTYGGGILGMWPATAASWLGMTIGACFAFALARSFGTPLAERFSGGDDLKRMEALSQRFGPLALILTRALPILAEACVLLMGASRLSWKRFLPPVLASNFVISLIYAIFGQFFQEINALPFAVVASAIIPLSVALAVRRWIPVMT